MEIIINTKGVVHDIQNHDEFRRVENFPEGDGVYAIEDGGFIIGYVDVRDKNRVSNLYDICLKTYFPTSMIVAINQDKRDIDLMSHIQDCCDKVCETIREAVTEHDNHMAIFIGQEHDEIKAEGNGITERTLLEALKIVSK